MEDDLEETIEASLRGIQAKPPARTVPATAAARPDVPRGRHRAGEIPGQLTAIPTQQPKYAGVHLAKGYEGRWKEIGEFLESFKRPEGKNAKEMVRFRRDATRYLVFDGALYL